MVVLARLLFCWNPGGVTGRIRFLTQLSPRLVHSNGSSQDKDKEELWREAEQCLAQLNWETKWSSALFNPTRSNLASTRRPDLESKPKSELEGMKRLRDLLAANPWLRQRRKFASKAVGALTRLQCNSSLLGEKEVALGCKELRLKLGDLPLPRGPGPRVLALDGGGMRGLVTLVMLQELERRTGRRIHELFDLVVGTSTGAIVAAIVCIRELSAKQALDIYRELGSQVFRQSILRGAQGLLSKQSYYGNHQLDIVLFRHFGTITLESTLMVDSVPLLAFVATDITRLKLAPHLFCNYPYPPGTVAPGLNPHWITIITLNQGQQGLHASSNSAELVTSLLASSAAPGYFPAVQVKGVFDNSNGGFQFGKRLNFLNNWEKIMLRQKSKLAPRGVLPELTRWGEERCKTEQLWRTTRLQSLCWNAANCGLRIHSIASSAWVQGRALKQRRREMAKPLRPSSLELWSSPRENMYIKLWGHEILNYTAMYSNVNQIYFPRLWMH